MLLEEGARVEIARLEVPAVPLLRLTRLGEKLHETPGGGPKKKGHPRVTGLDMLLVGVTVIVVIAELPAVIGEGRGLPERLKSGMFTLTFRVVEPLWE